MHRKFAAAALLMSALLLTPAPCASAAFDDMDGHWAEAQLEYAVESGWLTGFDDGTIRPDESVTGAQAAALICRILGAQTADPTGHAGWYAEAAGQAAHLGIIAPDAQLDRPITRGEAFEMAAEAFCLSPGGDGIAALTGLGIVSGSEGSLRLGDELTRAEFAVLLTRITALGEISASPEVDGFDGGTLWLSCAASGDVSLKNVTADRVVIRSQELDSLQLKNCDIGELILAHDGEPELKIQGVDTVIIAPGCSAALSGSGFEVALPGDGASVAIARGARADKIEVTGKNCAVEADGTVSLLRVLGADCRVDGDGVRELYLRAIGCELESEPSKLTDETDYGITAAEIRLEHPALIAPGEALSAYAELSGVPDGLKCRVLWYIDGELVSESEAVIGETDSFALEYPIDHRIGSPAEREVRFALEYTTAYGETQTAQREYTQLVDSVDERDVERVLELVTPDYLGDYTTEWAETHDYEPFEKEIWVNAKGYSSDTQYLIWVNQSHQRTNVFEGSEGNWKLIHEWVVGCGLGSNTPQGVFKTTWNQVGWFTYDYDVRPVVRFKGGGYAFHSRLYYPGTDELKDPGIGYPISAGCIRMYDEDIQWIYDNVPSGTTVVVY